MLMLLRFLGNSPWSRLCDAVENMRFQAPDTGFFIFFNILVVVVGGLTYVYHLIVINPETWLRPLFAGQKMRYILAS